MGKTNIAPEIRRSAGCDNGTEGEGQRAVGAFDRVEEAERRERCLC